MTSASFASGREGGRASRDAGPGFEDAAPVGTGEMVAIAFKYRWKIGAALVIPPLLAVALILLLPKSYRAQSDIMVKTGREYMAQGDGESASLTAPTSTKQEGINSEIALITSRAVAEAAINVIGLETLYPDLVASPPSSGSVLDAAVLQFERDLAVEPVKLSNVISTTFDARSPADARRVLDTVIRLYIDKHTQVFAGRRADGYRDSIDTALVEIRALEQRRSALKLANGVYDIDVQRKAVIGQRVDAESRLEDARLKQLRLTARLDYLTKTRKLVPATALMSSTERSDVRAHAAEMLVDLRQQEAALKDRLGGANPDLQRLHAQIEAVKHAGRGASSDRTSTTAPSPLRQQLEQDYVATGADLATTDSEIGRLATAVTVRTGELQRMERADLDLRDTVLQIDMMTHNLRAMQGRYEQARADEQTDIARQVSVVQVARANGSQRPVGPKALVFGMAGLLLGVLSAGVVALLAIMTSKTALTGDAAERRVGLPMLAVVPFNEDAEEMAAEDMAADEMAYAP